MINKKVQGTIEYLVIIAIVVVIALVVVGLLLQIMDQGSAIPEQTARTAWMSTSPIAVIDWDVNSDDYLSVVLKNNDYQQLLNVSIDVGIGSSLNDVNLAQGATSTITISSVGTTSGEKYSFSKEDIIITFDTPNITGRTQAAPADILGTAG
jgi:hypothetical protein